MPSSKRTSSQSTEQSHSRSSHRGPSNSDKNSQRTISELFATSKRLPASVDGTAAVGVPPSKRLKISHSISSPSPPPKNLTPAEMYSFGPSTMSRPIGSIHGVSKKPEVIDLTGSVGDDLPKPALHRRKPSGTVRPMTLKPQSGPRKLVVKNLKKTSQADPEHYYKQVWNQLDTSLSAIFVGGKLPYSLEELYKGVESLCRQDHAPEVYKRLHENCKHNISTRVLEPLLQTASTVETTNTLDAVVKAWATWTGQLTTIRSIFYFLDRSYLQQSQTLGSLEEMGVQLFRTHVYGNVNLKPQVLQGAYALLSADRHESLATNLQKLLTDAVRLLHALGVYISDFEPRVLGDSEGEFMSLAETTSASNDIAHFVSECQRFIDAETMRCDLFGLDKTTRDALEKNVEDVFIEGRQEILLDTDSISALLDGNDYSMLESLYSLVERKNLGHELRPPFEAYINKQGSEIVFDEKREQEMVPRLLEFKRKLDLVLTSCFRKHEGLGHSMREAYENFINKTKRSNMTWGTDNPKPGEMIAKYVDLILKGGSKAIPSLPTAKDDSKAEPAGEEADGPSTDEESEISSELDQVLELFRFVHGKAVFEAFYKRDLARRLLLGRSASADAEKLMLTRLKSECGAGFTHNLEQMFKDMEMAREEISSYRAMLEERQSKSPVDLNVNVLSAAAWPSYPDVNVEIPRSIQAATAGFEAHYKNKHTGRRLAWKHGLAHCQLKASFPRGKKEIVVSAFQAVVLLQFNDKEPGNPVSYAEIQAASNLEDTELKRTLQSLACAKYRVLSKTPKGRDVNNTDTFTINESFSDPKYRIKINQIQAKETKQENKETHERVAADRNFETQAAIVRIMKSRKTITHAELISEVIVATRSRGVLDPADIKKNIDKLIEKDYMERDEDVRNTYNYLA